ncbi:MAG: DUF5686 family protein [Crocinitomicaceae bacterium]|nr:DUF5686 family protein [Crocinitomicaceae bacterium]
MNFSSKFLIFFFLLLSLGLRSQHTLSGQVVDERNVSIPYANVYVKNNSDLRTQANVNGEYEMRLLNGEYFLVFSASGYEDRESYVTISNGDVKRNMQLFPLKVQQLEDFDISVKRTNPGRDIMLKVVARRDQINPWEIPHSVDVYIKASEKITRTGKKVKKDEDADPVDPFENGPSNQTIVDNDINFLETKLQRNYAPPSKVKEYRSAYKLRGNDRQLYYTTTVKTNFNFFQNLMYLNDLHQTPIMSPISNPGSISYKYRLEAQYEEDGHKIHKIKIIPRSSSTSTLSGYIYVIDSIWMIQKLDLTLSKGNLLRYDYFQIQQTYSHPGDTLNVLVNQKLIYGNKFKDEISACQTEADFTNYFFNPQFSMKFFGNEVSVTEKEAYKKDTSFWVGARTTALSEEEKQIILFKDSIRDRVNQKEYIDSVDRAFNKVTFWKVVWFGIDHRNREKKTQWTINSIAASTRPIYIAGPRVAPGFSYFKKWENEKYIDSYTELSYGFKNQDFKGRTSWKYRYDPFRQGAIGVFFSHDFEAIRSYDAISQIFKRSNFIEATQLRISHELELFNGFYINPEIQFLERRTLKGYKFVELLDSVLNNDLPSDFKSYQAAIANITISYVPGQKYMREPNRKVVLGSRWPTFYTYYEKGLPTIFGSDIDHDYLLFGIRQTFKIGTIGTSSYHIKAGQFLNTRSLKDADMKYNRRSDRLWFSNPLYSFQGFYTLLPTSRTIYEGHFVHHDNGSIINKIPFMKKTGIGLAFGAGALYITEYKWQHYEILGGLERNFKFSKRRLRLGIYCALSTGNNLKPRTDWKISFAVLDDRSMKWNF